MSLVLFLDFFLPLCEAFVLEAQIGASNLAELVTFGLFALSLIGAALLSVPDSRSRTTFIGIGVFWYLCSIATIFGVPLRPVVAVLTLVILAGSLFGTFRYLMTSEAKDTDALLAAVYGYLLLAMSWAILYFQIEKWVPGSFNLPEGADQWSSLLYFSIVTITTLGYGDVLPVSGQARMAAGFEAVVGVLYIAVLIGSIVGSFEGPKKP